MLTTCKDVVYLPTPPDLFSRFREARKASGLTQEQAAQAVGMSLSSITRKERGEQPVTMRDVWAMEQLAESQARIGRVPRGTGQSVRESESDGYESTVVVGELRELPRRLQAMAKRFEAEALELDANDDEMGWLRMNLYQPQTAKLFQMGQADRPATEGEQIEHFESFLKGLRANLEAQIALRTGRGNGR